jgi:hypothetical protein
MATRREILRHYFEETFDRHEVSRYAGADFEEFLALLRITRPDTTPAVAAASAATCSRPDLAKYGATYPPEPAVPREDDLASARLKYRSVGLVRRGVYDLRTVLAGTDARVFEAQQVTLEGWSGLGVRGDWAFVELRACKSTDPAPLSPPVAADSLSVNQCDPTCVGAVLRSTSARTAFVYQPDGAYVFDLRLLAGHRRLERLTVIAPLVHGARHLQVASLRYLWLNRSTLDAEVRSLLERLAPSLETLGLVTLEPFLPRDLPPLPRLQQLTVGAFPAVRSEWLEFAVGSYPRVGVDFANAQGYPRWRRYSVAESYHDHDVLCRLDGAARRLRVTAEAEGDMGALGEGLRSRAKQERRSVTWSARPGGHTLEAADLDTVRWALDWLIAAGRGAGTPPVGTSAPPVSRATESKPARREPFSSPTLRSLRLKHRFTSWEGHVRPALIREARSILRETVTALVELGPAAPKPRKRAALRRCIETFNRLDRANDHFITTIEAEDIVAELDEVAALSGLENEPDLVDEWRDF